MDPKQVGLSTTPLVKSPDGEKEKISFHGEIKKANNKLEQEVLQLAEEPLPIPKRNRSIVLAKAESFVRAAGLGRAPTICV